MAARNWLWLAVSVAALSVLACVPGGSPVESAREAPAQLPAPSPAEATRALSLPGGPRARVEAAIENVRNRELTTANGFWTVFHGILGLGPGVMLRKSDSKTGEKVNALDYICKGGELRGLRILPTRHGLDVPWPNGPQGVNIPQGVGQGHQDQFVAEMGQWGMPPDRKFVVDGKTYTFMDFVNHSQMRARLNANQELSWAILLIAQYKGLDASWTNTEGEALRLEDLVRYEADASVEQAPCGGTHRLFGLSWVYHMHLQQGGKTEGVWKDIADKTAKYRDRARKYQNADGSFSTKYFDGPEKSPNKQAQISTSGHILEWLALALTDQELRQQWVQDAANAVSLMILDLQDQSIDGGALYHAVHGLQIYHARAFGRSSFVPPELLYPQPSDRPPLSLAPPARAAKLP
jgi:hypothetical protein